MGEFELIDRFFASLGASRPDVVTGVGDDAAVLSVPAGHELVACVDTLVEGRHFPADMDAHDIGWRSLAVNLSDLAAMGALPRWAMLGVALPAADDVWVGAFARGFFALAGRFGVNPKTIAKWKRRTVVTDAPMGPKSPKSTVLSQEEEAVIVAFRKHTLLPLDDCLYALQASIPHLTRSALHRCLQRHGISRLPETDGS